MCVRESYTSLFANDRVSDLEHSVAPSPWPHISPAHCPSIPISSKSDLGSTAEYLPCFLLIYFRIERVEWERALHDVCLCKNLFQLSETFLCVMMHSTLSGWPGSCNLFSCSLKQDCRSLLMVGWSRRGFPSRVRLLFLQMLVPVEHRH